MKPRIDRWDAALSDQQRWEIFEKGRCWSYPAVAKWMLQEFNLEKAPSPSAYYAWVRSMGKEVFEERKRQIVEAKLQVVDLAQVKMEPQAMVTALQNIGTDCALNGDMSSAKALHQMAAGITSGLQKEKGLELRGQSIKLDREKFEAAERRLAAVQAVVGDAKQNGLTLETLKKIEEAAGLL